MLLIHRLTPFSSFMTGVIVWFALFLIAPVIPRWSHEPLGYLLLLSVPLSLYIGYQLISGQIQKKIILKSISVNFILFLSFIGFLGAFLRFYDVSVVRDVNLLTGAASIREALNHGNSSWISIFSAFCSPFAIASAIIAQSSFKFRWLKMLTFFSALSTTLIPLLMGSRSPLLFIVVILMIYYCLTIRHLAYRHLLMMLALICFLIGVSIILFEMRIQSFDRNILEVARSSAYTFAVPLNDSALQSLNGPNAKFLALFGSVIQYALGGVFEFLWLVELKQTDFSYGQHLFFFIPKFISVLTGVPDFAFQLNPRIGVFQTIMGDAYLDFGTYAPLFIMAFASYTGWLSLRLQLGDILALPAYIFCCAQCFLGIFLGSFLANAAMLSNVSFLILALIGRFIIFPRFIYVCTSSNLSLKGNLS